MSEKVNAILTYKDLKLEISGDPESVMASIASFLSKHVPNLDLARKISVSYSFTELVKMFSDYVKMTPEGPKVWVSEHLSDKEKICLQLIAARIAKEAGKAEDDLMLLKELYSLTGVKHKSLSSRLSELVKDGIVERGSKDDSVAYRITTFGIHKVNELLEKKKS